MDRIQGLKGENDGKVDFSATVPGIDLSLSQIGARLVAILGSIKEFEQVDDLVLTPNSWLLGLQEGLSQLSSIYANLNNQLDSLSQAGGVDELGSDDFTVSSGDGSVSVNLGQIFHDLPGALDKSVQNYLLLAITLRGGGYKDFSSAVTTLSRHANKVRVAEAELEALLATIKDHEKDVAGSVNSSRELAKEIRRVKGETDSEGKTISECLSESTQKLTGIRETAESAEGLKASIQSYRYQIDRYQTQQDAHEKRIREHETNVDRLSAQLKEFESEIRRLNAQAEAMLTGATVAGLASEFGGLRDKLTKEVRLALLSFYVGIFVLFVSALPLALFVVPGLGELVPGLAQLGAGPAEASSPSEFLGQALVRAVFLLPGAWLVRFMAGRHAALFRLREHYSYKYSVAASVEGFKKQAEPHADEIAAVAFFELTSNPANRMEGRGRPDPQERHPNPIMDKIMAKMGLTADGRRQ